MLGERKRSRGFARILRVVSCFIPNMIVLFIVIQRAVAVQIGLKKRTVKPLERSVKEKKSAKGIADISLTGLKLGVDIGESDKTVVSHVSTLPGSAGMTNVANSLKEQMDAYASQVLENMEVPRKLLNTVNARQQHILKTQYQRYLDPAREELHYAAQTIMAICEEIGSNDFISVSGGYKVIIKKDDGR